MLPVGIAGRHEAGAERCERTAVLFQQRVVHGAVHRRSEEHRGSTGLHPAKGRGERGRHDAVGNPGRRLSDGVVGGGCDQIGVERCAVREMLRPPGELRHQRVAG